MAEVKSDVTEAVVKEITPAKVSVTLTMNEDEAIYVLAVLGCGAQWATGPGKSSDPSVYDILQYELESVVHNLDEKESTQTQKHVEYLRATIDAVPRLWTPSTPLNG